MKNKVFIQRARQHILIAALFIIALSITGCSRSGNAESLHIQTEANGQTDSQPTEIKTNRLTLKVPAGYNVIISDAKAKQPLPPDEPATTAANKSGADADSGKAGSGGAVAGLSGSFWIGILLVIAGGLLFLAKRAGVAAIIAPGPTGILMRIAGSLPPFAGLYIAGVGVALIVLPWFLTTIQPLIIPLAVASAVIGFWWLFNYLEEGKREKSRIEDGQGH